MSAANPRRTPAALSASNKQCGLSLNTTNMALRKGATFHSPPSPASPSADAFIPPLLSRSQTSTDVVDAKCRRVALDLHDIDDAIAQTDNLSLSTKGSKHRSLRDTSLPVPHSFLGLLAVDTAMEKPARFARPSNHQDSDSGLGTSISSTDGKNPAAGKGTKTHVSVSASALTRSAASSPDEILPPLGQTTCSRINTHTILPLLGKQVLRDFHPIVLDVPRRITTKDITCLRDVEKTLILVAPGRAKTASLYLKFCLASVQCIQATVDHLSDREQIRPGDRPYTNGYFIDLKEQIFQYARELHAIKTGADDSGDMDTARTDEIKLHGGVAENGQPVELVRVRKDGTVISMATGNPVDMDELPATIKRSLSEQLEDQEEIKRSMARRKKNASPEELAPKRCREPGCKKEFKRPCDLTKHEKTHSRPWNCPMVTCKYHKLGWPTEKEMDRHVNDKHSDSPAMYSCTFSPCPYKSKRESNLKQHMEKAHKWVYVRTKTNGKRPGTNSGSSVQQTPPLGNVSTPSTNPVHNAPTPNPINDTIASDFPLYTSDSDWFETYGNQPYTLDAMDLELENTSPPSSYEHYAPYQNGSSFIVGNEDLYSAQVRLAAQFPAADQFYNKTMPQQMPIYQAPQPFPAPQARLDVPRHFSPAGHENALLFSPNALREVDEGFDDAFGAGRADFPLFPASVNKGSSFQPLFGEAPGANLGFSQTSQQDMLQPMGWPALYYQPPEE